MNKKYLVVGGDLRFIKLSEFLSESGFDVYILGFDRNAILSKDIHIINNVMEIKSEMDFIILPLPVSLDEVSVNMPFSSKVVPIEMLCSVLKKGGTVFGGRISPNVKDLFDEHKISVIDYSVREEFCVLNAISTAEGAIQVAMEETARTISGEKILILGMGRISKVLIKQLSGFNAKITVAARKFSDIAWAETYGCEGIHISSLAEKIGEFNIIFGTVPSVILTEEILAKTDKNTLIIDLASKPGGVDFDAATSLGVKVIWLLSLPGKVAPLTAGETIGKTILNIISERGESFA